tara:strand:- start:51 stop:215 length:165 start_codon:yes stop_codon:yes gene_type:complete
MGCDLLSNCILDEGVQSGKAQTLGCDLLSNCILDEALVSVSLGRLVVICFQIVS